MSQEKLRKGDAELRFLEGELEFSTGAKLVGDVRVRRYSRMWKITALETQWHTQGLIATCWRMMNPWEQLEEGAGPQGAGMQVREPWILIQGGT